MNKALLNITFSLPQ